MNLNARFHTLHTFVLLAGLALFVSSAPAQALPPSSEGRVSLPNSIRPVSTQREDLAAARTGSSRPAFSRTLTAAEAAAPLKVEIVLKMRNYPELQRRVAAGETINPAEMAERYLPRQSGVEAVSQWLKSQGLSVRVPGAGRALIVATGSSAQWQKALEVNFARVAYKGAEYTAAMSAPTLPGEVAALVANIHGLQPFLHPHKFAAKVSAASTFQPPYLVSDILTAYDAKANGLTGAGQQIGIVIDTVPATSDLTQFWSDNGIAQSLSNIITVNVSGSDLPQPSGEETLDVSWSSGIASGAQIVIYACGDLSNVDESYSQILDDLQSGARPNLHQISMSYAGGELTDESSDDLNSTSQMFTSMAAYGVTLFASSGDDGANADGDGTVQVGYPASDPSVVGVGGTTLTLSGNGSVSSETAWSFYSGSEGASGGGVSSYFSRPSWQIGSTIPAGTMRLVPDVSIAGDPNMGGYLIFQGQVDEYGGTSWSSPTWAGLCALLNEALQQEGATTLGVANTTFYPLLGTASFRDITTGSNGAYSAGIGYDLVTGIGVPDFDVLLSSVEGATTVPTLTFSSAAAATGEIGMTFSYQIAASGSPTSFLATGLPAGLSLNPATGLISGTPTATGTFSITLTASSKTESGTANLSLRVFAVPTVNISANMPAVAASGGAVGQFTITRVRGQIGKSLQVFYAVRGSAQPGVDYVALRGSKIIPAGQTSARVNVTPLGSDLRGFPAAAVKLILEIPGNGTYKVGTEPTARVRILAGQ